MTDNIMLDTNLWVYLYSKQSIEKETIVRQILVSNSTNLILSTQILGELYNVFRRKKLINLDQATTILKTMIDSFTIEPIDHPKVSIALEISSQYGYSYWDSLIIATALDCQCSILYSEDMQHNILIRDRLRIINPLI
jgi:predicted nucleic acid-binding protein